MALRLRRGTDTERQLITPVEGELVYATDTKELFIGDGTTLGGIRVTGEVADTLSGLTDVEAALPQDGDVLIYDSITDYWIAAELPLGDLSDVSTVGIVDGQVLAYDAATSAFIPSTVQGVGGVIEVDRVNSNLIPIVGINAGIGAYDQRWEEGFFVNLDISGGIVGQDSVSVYRAFNNTFTANFDGDLTGSVFSDDSTLIVDGVNSQILAREFAGDNTKVFINTTNRVEMEFQRRTENITDVSYGAISFTGSSASEGERESARLVGGDLGFFITHDSTGTATFPQSATTAITETGIGFGTYSPSVGLEIIGAGIITGGLSADVTGSLFSDSSTMLIDGTDGKLMIANINAIGETGNAPVDTGTVDSWLEVTVNGATKYIPLYD